jgi:hypothetical protein
MNFRTIGSNKRAHHSSWGAGGVGRLAQHEPPVPGAVLLQLTTHEGAHDLLQGVRGIEVLDRLQPVQPLLVDVLAPHEDPGAEGRPRLEVIADQRELDVGDLGDLPQRGGSFVQRAGRS